MSLKIDISKKELLESIDRAIYRKYKFRLKKFLDLPIKLSFNDTVVPDEIKTVTIHIDTPDK